VKGGPGGGGGGGTSLGGARVSVRIRKTIRKGGGERKVYVLRGKGGRVGVMDRHQCVCGCRDPKE